MPSGGGFEFELGSRGPTESSKFFDFDKDTHNADSIVESKVIYYLEQCALKV